MLDVGERKSYQKLEAEVRHGMRKQDKALAAALYQWPEGDEAFRSTHLIPKVLNLSFENFEEFYAERTKLISAKLQAL